jgi:hypothetical protein
MEKSQRNSEHQSFFSFLSIQLVKLQKKKTNLKRVWITEADSKILLQKRAVLESKFKKHLMKQPFCRTLYESANA